MAIDWSKQRYGYTSARVGFFDISAGWESGGYIAEIRDLGIRVKGLESLDAAKARALSELRKALESALAALKED